MQNKIGDEKLQVWLRKEVLIPQWGWCYIILKAFEGLVVLHQRIERTVHKPL